MKTIILFWNPEISDVSVTAFRMGMKHEDRTTWEVHCHDRAEVGDLVYLVRCDKPTGGIVMRGIIASKPERGPHWYNEGCHSWYVDIAVTHVLNPLTAPLITVDQLQREIPGFKWDGGHSGRVLRAGWAKRLNNLWENYLTANPTLFKGRTGYDFTKEAYVTPLEATLFTCYNTDIWLYMDAGDVTFTRVVNLDAPEEEIPGIDILDGREETTDLTFNLKDALKAFDVNNRFELYKVLTHKFSHKEAMKDMVDCLEARKVKYELDTFNADEPYLDDEE